MASNFDDLTTCPVCWVDYTETGDHVPRILPCHHSVCEVCIGTLLKNETIACPECRKRFRGTGVKSFQQNRYILANIKKQGCQGKTQATERCKEHGKDFAFYCQNMTCQKNVCPSCMLKSHKSHNLVEIEEVRKKAALTAKLDSIKKDLEEEKAAILKPKENFRRRLRTA